MWRTIIFTRGGFPASVIASFNSLLPRAACLTVLTCFTFALVANLVVGTFDGFPVAAHAADISLRIGDTHFLARRTFFYAVTVKTSARAAAEVVVFPKAISIAFLRLLFRNALFVARGTLLGTLDTSVVLTNRFVCRARLALPNGIDARSEYAVTNTFNITGATFGGIAFAIIAHGNIGRAVHKTPEFIFAAYLKAKIRHTSRLIPFLARQIARHILAGALTIFARRGSRTRNHIRPVALHADAVALVVGRTLGLSGRTAFFLGSIRFSDAFAGLTDLVTTTWNDIRPETITADAIADVSDAFARLVGTCLICRRHTRAVVTLFITTVRKDQFPSHTDECGGLVRANRHASIFFGTLLVIAARHRGRAHKT